MEEMKFKFWDNENDCWLDVETVELNKYNKFARVHAARVHLSLGIINPPQVIPLQYTGLHDKNGKEIYEGDILEIDGMKNNRRFNITIPDIFYLWWEMGLEGEERLEVLGNIYENLKIEGNKYELKR